MIQADLEDAFGVSTVDVNRTLQKLRSEGLITLKGGALTILNLRALKAAAGFDPTYLEWTGVGSGQGAVNVIGVA